MGFDEIRVRYRSQRRATIRTIIEKNLTEAEIITFIENQKEIPAIDRARFTRTVLEDLEHIDQSRIAGLGITPEQLELWKKSKKQ